MSIFERFLFKSADKNTKKSRKALEIDTEIRIAREYWQRKRVLHGTLAFLFLFIVFAYIFGVCLFLHNNYSDLLYRFYNGNRVTQTESSSISGRIATVLPKNTQSSHPASGPAGQWFLGASEYSRIVVFFVFLLLGARLLSKIVFLQMFLWEDAAEKVVTIETYITFQKQSSVELKPSERIIFLKNIFRSATASYHNKGISESKMSINLGR